jgi:hypothetical protein
MPRKLKTYVTSIGFFELAIAAPSMKAALSAWGAGPNLFHQGFAYETDDPAVVAATMAKPGVVLKRAVGSKGAFKEDAELPNTLPVTAPRRAEKSKPKPKAKPAKQSRGKKSADVVHLPNRRAAEQAAAAYEREEAKREREQKKEEAAQQKERKRRKEATAKAEAALEEAERRHTNAKKRIANERAALDQRDENEDARWAKEKRKLDIDLPKARK